LTKVSDMIGDFAHPAGEVGRGVDQELAESVAREMRELLQNIFEFNKALGEDVLFAAWDHLNAMERRAWALVVQTRGRDGCQ
jgi:hypothetical protein